MQAFLFLTFKDISTGCGGGRDLSRVPLSQGVSHVGTARDAASHERGENFVGKEHPFAGEAESAAFDLHETDIRKCFQFSPVLFK